MFQIGRDKKFRPVIYCSFKPLGDKKKYGINPKLTNDDMLEAIDLFCVFVKTFFFRKYFIESWVMIIDSAGFGIFTFPFAVYFFCFLEFSSCQS